MSATMRTARKLWRNYSPIKLARLDAGLSQSELGELITPGLNDPWQPVLRVERGQGNPRYETFVKYAEALEVEPEVLFARYHAWRTSEPGLHVTADKYLEMFIGREV